MGREPRGVPHRCLRWVASLPGHLRPRVDAGEPPHVTHWAWDEPAHAKRQREERGAKEPPKINNRDRKLGEGCGWAIYGR